MSNPVSFSTGPGRKWEHGVDDMGWNSGIPNPGTTYDGYGGNRMFETPASNPVRMAYMAYFMGDESKARQSWDQTSVLYAVRGARNYWNTRTTGYNHINGDGGNVWRDSPDKNHVLLTHKMPDNELADIINDLMVKK